jgi:hypothetical protein
MGRVGERAKKFNAFGYFPEFRNVTPGINQIVVSEK